MLLKTVDVMEFLKDKLGDVIPVGSYYCDVLDVNAAPSLTVYRSPISGRFGALKNDPVACANFSLRVRGTLSSVESEAIAFSVFSKLQAIGRGDSVGGHVVNYVSVDATEPERIGRDKAGVVEYLIEFSIYYNK